MIRSWLAAMVIPATVGAAASVAVVSGAGGLIIGLLVNAFLLCEVAGFGEVFPIRFPRRYFRTTWLERPWLYEALGVRQFKRLMTSAVYRKVNPGFKLSDGKRGLESLEQMMESAEAPHMLLFLFVSVLAVAAWLAGWRDSAVWLVVFNMVFNAYPVMLHRYNRLRLQRLRHEHHHVTSAC